MTGRERADRCPGVLRPFLAGDGALVRLRVPGGRIRVDTLAEVMALGTDFGAPVVQLTSRGNIQLRALPDPLPEAFVERVEATGLLPSASHEQARNILAAPMAADLQPLVAELDAAILAEPRLAELPGRFLWALSDTSGALLSEPWDAAYQALGPEHGLVLVANRALAVRRADAVPALVDRALRFLDSRPGPGTWNVRELPSEATVFADTMPYAAKPAPPLRPGPVGPDLVVGVPLGMLRPTQVAALVELAHEVRITPWRSVVLPEGARHADLLRGVGLVDSADSPWARLSACVGAPSCRRTSAPTLDLATEASRSLPGDGPRVHVVGCERRCGEPSTQHVTVVAPHDICPILAAAGVTDD